MSCTYKEFKKSKNNNNGIIRKIKQTGAIGHTGHVSKER